MIAAIHQPNYLPWLGYFYKIASCQSFIFLDNVQYTKNSFINRNQIKTPNGPQWLTVDVLTRGHPEQKIKDVKTNNQVTWARNHWKAIHLNYAKAPYFNHYKDLLENVYNQSWDSLSLLNQRLIEIMVKILHITNIQFIQASSLKAEGESTELLINICKEVGADTYLSGFGGYKYMDEYSMKEAVINVVKYDFIHPVYRQQWGDFLPNMSILDLIFNEGENSLEILKAGKRTS